MLFGISVNIYIQKIRQSDLSNFTNQLISITCRDVSFEIHNRCNTTPLILTYRTTRSPLDVLFYSLDICKVRNLHYQIANRVHANNITLLLCIKNRASARTIRFSGCFLMESSSHQNWYRSFFLHFPLQLPFKIIKLAYDDTRIYSNCIIIHPIWQFI